MGNSSCGCGSNKQRKKTVFSVVKNKQWADAVNHLNLAGVKMLHQTEPDVLNEFVSPLGLIAIHVAVKKQHFRMFSYLLKYGGDINAQTGIEGDTCLHLAVKNNDLRIIRELFNCGIDDQILNSDDKTGYDLCINKNFRREFLRAKNHRLNIIQSPIAVDVDVDVGLGVGVDVGVATASRDTEGKQQYSDDNNDFVYKQSLLKKINSHLDTVIGGVPIKDISNKELKKVIHDSNNDIIAQKKKDKQKYHLKQKEISLRANNYITSFGQEVGCEIDEIANTTQQYSHQADKLWKRWVKKEEIIKTNDLAKVIYGLAVLTLKNKEKTSTTKSKNKSTKPPTEPIKRLTHKIYKMLPVYNDVNGDNIKRKKRHILTKDDFIDNFHDYLYKAHDKFKRQTNKYKQKKKRISKIPEKLLKMGYGDVNPM